MPAPIAPVLILTRAWLAERIPPDAYLAAVEAAFIALAAGELQTPAVGHLDGQGGAFHIKAAAGTVPPYLAVIKVNGNFPGNPARYGLPTIQGFLALLDAERGSVLALMDSTEITARRTAAASALAARHLARAESSRLAVIGCGVQAACHVQALRGLFPLRSVRYLDIETANAAAFGALVEALGLGGVPAASVDECLGGADIVVTSTPSNSPLLHERHAVPGLFVAAVGADNPHKHELAPGFLARARVVPDILAQAAVMGDLHHALAGGAMRVEQVHAELAAVVAGTRPGRTDPAQTFVFDSTGSAIEDLAAARIAYGIASADPEVLRVPLNG